MSRQALFFSGLILVAFLGGGFLWLLFQPRKDPRPTGGVGIGRAAPDFTLTDAKGHPVTLSGLRGHPVILNFWASWCAPCRSEMPMLEQFYQDHQAQGVVLLGVNEGEPANIITQYVQENGISYPILADGTLQFLDPSSYYPVPLPRTYFLDTQGIVRAVVDGEMSPRMLLARYQQING